MYAVFFHGASDDLLLKVVPAKHEAEELQKELVGFYAKWLDQCDAIVAEGDPAQHRLVQAALDAWGRDFGGTVFGISVVPLNEEGRPTGYLYESLD